MADADFLARIRAKVQQQGGTPSPTAADTASAGGSTGESKFPGDADTPSQLDRFTSGISRRFGPPESLPEEPPRHSPQEEPLLSDPLANFDPDAVLAMAGKQADATAAVTAFTRARAAAGRGLLLGPSLPHSLIAPHAESQATQAKVVALLQEELQQSSKEDDGTALTATTAATKHARQSTQRLARRVHSSLQWGFKAAGEPLPSQVEVPAPIVKAAISSVLRVRDPVLPTRLRVMLPSLTDTALASLHGESERLLGEKGPLHVAAESPFTGTTVDTSRASEGAELNISIGKLELTDHPLFIREEYLASQLSQRFQEYRVHLRRALVLSSRGYLDAALEEATARERTSFDKQFSTWKEVSYHVFHLLETSKRLHELTQSQYALWQDIKAEQTQQGFVSSPIRLFLRPVNSDSAEEGRSMAADTPSRARPSLDFFIQMRQLESAMGIIRRMQHEVENAQRHGNPLGDSRSHEDVLHDMNVAERKLQEGIAWLQANRQVEYIVEVDKEGNVTPDTQGTSVTNAERKRRKAVRALRLWVRVLVNGRKAGRVQPMHVSFPGYAVDFDKTFSLALRRRPMSVEVQVWQRGALQSKLVSTAPVQVPGTSLKANLPVTSIPPVAGRYHFISPRPIRHWRWPQPITGSPSGPAADTTAGPAGPGASAAGPGAEAGDSAPPGRPRAPAATVSGLRERHTTGYIHARAQWVRGLLPDRGPNAESAETAEALQKKQTLEDTTAAKAGDDARVGDPNDPRNLLSTKKTQARAGSGQDRRLGDGPSRFRTAAVRKELTFLADAVTLGDVPATGDSSSLWNVRAARHKLLRLRADKPELFNEPVPLSEEDIRASRSMAALLHQVNEEQQPQASPAAMQASLRRSEAFGTLGWSRNLSDLRAPLDSTTMFGHPLPGQGKDAAAYSDQDPIQARVQAFVQSMRSMAAGANTAAAAAGKLAGVSRVGGHFLAPSVASIVVEPSLPAFKAACNPAALAAAMQPKRKLAPRRGGSAPAALHGGEKLGSLALSVQIVAAKNLPVRRPMVRHRMSSSMLSRRGGEDKALMSKASAPLSAYAELRFGGQAAKTTAAVGVNPQWNEVLTVAVEPPVGGFTPLALSKIQDDITITLYDEEVTEAASGALSSVVKRERRMIGSVRIPFSAVYRQGNLRGDLRLDTPMANLGYQYMRSAGPSSTALEPLPTPEVLDRGAKRTSADSDTYVSIRMSLDPKPPLYTGSDSQIGEVVSSRRGTVAYASADRIRKREVETATKWSSKYSKPNRPLRVVLKDKMGRYVTLNRMLVPLAPPPTTLRSDGSVTIGNIQPHGPMYSAGSAQSPGYPANLFNDPRHGDAPGGQDDEYDYDIEASATNPTARGWQQSSATPSARQQPTLMSTPAEVVHYVSLFPSLYDWEPHVGFPNFCLSTNDFVAFGVGTPLDHAIALACFLASLERHPGRGAEGFRPEEGAGGGLHAVGGAGGWESLLVQGRTAVEGIVTWVMRRPIGSTEAAHIRFIDPCQGLCFSARDATCPLTEVHAVYSPTNAWVNVSAQTAPYTLMWDFNDTKAWAPLVTAKALAAQQRRTSGTSGAVSASSAVPVGAMHDAVDVNAELGIQPPVSFHGVDVETLEETEWSLNETIQDAIRSWRGNRNYLPLGGNIQQKLRSLLLELEAARLRGDESSLRSVDLGTVHREAIGRAFSGSKVHGYPMHSRFISKDDLLSLIRQTRLMEAEGRSVSLCTAVLLVPYPGNIYSVWLYPLAVIRD